MSPIPNTLVYIAATALPNAPAAAFDDPITQAYLYAIQQTLNWANIGPPGNPNQILAAAALVNQYFNASNVGLTLDGLDPYTSVQILAPYQIPGPYTLASPDYVQPTGAPAVAPATMAPSLPAGLPTPTTTTPATTPPPTLTPKDDPGNPFVPGNYCDQYPADPICTSVAYDNIPPTIIIFGPTGEPPPSTVNITINGPSGAEVAQSVDSALGDLWDATVGAVDGVLADAINAIQKVLTDIGNALKAAWNILSYLAGLILGFLKTLLTDVIDGIVKVLEEAKNLAQDLYKKVLLPIAQGVINLRDALIDVYQRFIRPMLIVLQDIRKVLSILAAFHVGWAQKLDAKLADLEARITRPFLYLLSFVNAVSNWINLIITAGYLLQKSLFLNSLLAYVGEALNLQLNAMNQPPSAAAVGAAAAANATEPAAQASQDLVNYLGNGLSPLQTGMQPYVDQFTGYIAEGPY